MDWLIPVGIALAVYLLPSYIASQRHHAEAGKIRAINFFLGWTGVGWLAALAWAITGEKKQPDDRRPYGTSGMYIIDDGYPQVPRPSTLPRQYRDESDADYAARLRRLT